jgi:hypothetical protein
MLYDSKVTEISYTNLSDQVSIFLLQDQRFRRNVCRLLLGAQNTVCSFSDTSIHPTQSQYSFIRDLI